jgi:hypothetical protein
LFPVRKKICILTEYGISYVHSPITQFISIGILIAK